ncbi:MAG: disulfide bond formation protein B [Candidatus Nitrotoga sp.]|nr:disulfide bond formation protein B [Candidatus Nitrotoga sp.]MBP0117211.1 disulfide bond formation protein B [Candidatus Nitrotoga sp.]MBP0122870.1 disulfide bond formation protein B [Candidatus Nitrotoga sp.]MBP0125847.1 disulfide bond formation protein B [Candidatus Nitrotoga sp.]
MYNLLSRIPSRWLHLIGVLIITVALCAALYIQYVQHQEPCPLCMIQRLIFIVLLVLFSLVALHNPRGGGIRIYGALIGLTALCGASVAGRHIWLQHLPKNEVPTCGPGLDYLLNSLPATEVLQELIHGSGECAAKGWSFFGLGMPEWSLFLYTFLGLLAVMASFKR